MPRCTPCLLPGGRHEMLCGQVLRPLDPARGDAGPQIDVHFAVVPALSRAKRADPVFLLAGGPGQSAIALMAQVMPLFSRLNQRRDIVFVDQRGTGRSFPLPCDEADMPRLADQADVAQTVERLRACQRRLESLPGLGGPAGLGFFTTSVAAQDLDAVRRELGVPQINLVGASYGTRLALEYQRQFPSHLRRSVLDGVAPPDMALPVSQSVDTQAVLDALFAACAREAECAQRYPRLRADWEHLLARLPRPVEVGHPVTGQPERFILNRDGVLSAVRGALYSPVLASALPEAIAQAAQGRLQGLFGLGSVLSAGPREQAPAMGMHFAVTCAEDVPALDAMHAAQGGRDFGSSTASVYRQVCAGWPRSPVPSEFRSVPAAKTPVLLLSGGLDPVTPPRHGERIARALGPQARHVVVEAAGHGLLSLGCMPEVMMRFLDADDDRAALGVDASCAQSIPVAPSVPAGEPGGASAMIHVEQLAKSFLSPRRKWFQPPKRVQAVRSISFDAPDAHILGLLGPNGAGKTTTLRMLAGLVSPDQGRLSVDDIDVTARPRQALARMGLLSDARGLYSRLTARENIVYFGRLQGLLADQAHERAEELARVLEMTALLERRAEGFSQGERMKTSLARALVHDPAHIVLDEPTNGLDVTATRALRDVLRHLRSPAGGGKCILFCTHIMQEVEKLCDSVVVVANGCTVARGTARELMEQTGQDDFEDAFVQLACAPQEVT